MELTQAQAQAIIDGHDEGAFVFSTGHDERVIAPFIVGELQDMLFEAEGEGCIDFDTQDSYDILLVLTQMMAQI